LPLFFLSSLLLLLKDPLSFFGFLCKSLFFSLLLLF
jgi:hypothetical protein